MNPASRPRVGVVCDLLEEGWASMDLVADMLLARLGEDHADTVEAVRLRPAAIGTGKALVRWWSLHSARRTFRRYRIYPRWLRERRHDFDVFHIVDHSYSHLVHAVTPAATIVTCHDVDLFRPLLGPCRRESRLPRTLVARVLDGLTKASVVTCDSASTRDELLRAGMVPPERLVVVPNGVHPACDPTPDAAADEAAARWLGPPPGGRLDLLHVGSTIARKRIDLLLEVFAEVRRREPAARLVRVGGPFTPAQQRLADRLGVGADIVVLPFLERAVLASVYRRAAVVLQPSEREGFGLPVIEAMACGTPVVATDLPVLREVGGAAASYCALGDTAAWRDAVLALLDERRSHPDRRTLRVERALAQAGRFSWQAYARTMVTLYLDVHRGVEGAAPVAAEAAC